MIYSRFYWRLGFQSSLYDILTPEAYLESMRRLVECVPTSSNSILLDAGCGSGSIIKYLKSIICEGTYIGIDFLLEGLVSARVKAEIENISNRVHLIQSDLTQSIPMPRNSVDIIIAHFSLYTMNPGKRGFIFKEFRRLLRKEGTFALVEPSPEYSAERIIEKSNCMVSVKGVITEAWIKKWILYPLSYQFGLKFIERQLKEGVWRTSDGGELCNEIRSHGYEVKHAEPVYANSATLVIAG